MSADVIVSPHELEHRTILREDLKADRAAFLDTRIPGSEAKINYARRSAPACRRTPARSCP